MSLSDFVSYLGVFGPLTAVSLFISGVLLPGALVCAIFAIWQQRSKKQIWVLGAICLAMTGLFLNNAKEYWFSGFLSTFIAGAIPFVIQTMALIWLFGLIKKLVDAPAQHQKIKGQNAKN